MFTGYDEQRLLAMTDREKRWLDNIKKAFYGSDRAFINGQPQDHCLEELLKAVDTAKTLRRSLRGEDVSPRENKKRFIELLGLEIPDVRTSKPYIELCERETGKLRQYTLGEIIYAVRCCMIHENENLNAEENVDFHILVDWSPQHPFAAGYDGKIVCSGYVISNRLREILAKFITGIEGKIARAKNAPSFTMHTRPALGSIIPIRERRKRD